MKKQGISLVILVITIIVMIIIATIAIVGTNDLLVSANIQDFASEVSTIEDSIKQYYVTHGVLPVKSTKYTSTEFLNKHEGSYRTKLNTEISNNKDTQNTFCVVDLKLLEITTPERGNEVDSLDVYLVATNSLNVYYLKGVEIKDILYFSNEELIDKKKVEDNIVISEVQNVNLKSSMIITKSTNTWTNNLEVKVDYVLNSGESMYYSINDKPEKALTGNTVALNANTLTTAEISSLSSTSKLKIYRRSNGTNTETKEVDISNLDLTLPTVSSVQVNSSNTGYNTLTFSVSDNLSGAKAIYYDFVKVLDENGNEKNYYTENTEMTEQYLLNNGKASFDLSIKLDKNIKSIKYILVDNAGNATNPVEYTLDNTYLTYE